MAAGDSPKHVAPIHVAHRRLRGVPDQLRRQLRRSRHSARSLTAALTAAMLAIAGIALAAVVGAGPASAAPVYQIKGDWAPNTPSTVKSGDVVTGVWRVNVNDDKAAPGNDPVDNVNFSVTLQNGVFNSIPDACLTTGVTPASSISADGKTLVCNVGTKNEGTAVVVQAPVKVDGPTGSQLTASGTIAGQTANLDPINIVNQFGMDIRWGEGTPDFSQGSGYFDLDYEWTLSKLLASDPGPQSITYNLTIASAQGAAVQVGPQACTPYSVADAANGHPWSGGSHPANQMDSFVGGCTLTQTGPTTFTLTLTGINYNPTNVPTKDSTGAALPTDQVALASGSIWVRVLTSAEGSVEVSSDAPTYTSTTGQTAQDDPSNNTESKAWTGPGVYSSGWGRGYTGSGGTTWDDSYQLPAGSGLGQYMDTLLQLNTARDPSLPVGMCSAIDTKYATFTQFSWGIPAGGVPGAVVEYYTGTDPTLDPTSAGYNPDAFSCAGTGGWSTTPPADPTQVRAVRVTMTQAQAEAGSPGAHITPVINQTIKPTTPAGTDVWSFMWGQADDGSWFDRDNVCITPVPGGRYPCTTGFADVVHVVTAAPAISKSVDRSVITPGTPATYTLSYAANGAGALPPTVDGYQIVDTLPAHMTYVTGSATPAPTVTTNGTGDQVLTWTLNGVPTNAVQTLTYQAVADSSVTPGQTLTNNATASYGGITTNPATAQVTVSTDGYTTIAKTADEPFIPNVDGKGDGSGSWTVTLRSFDPLPQPYTDTIDVLPYTGDKRGTSFSGSYTLQQPTLVAGATAYYTTAAPSTLSDDPDDPSNGKADDTTGNTVGWSTTFTPNATAVRVIGPALDPGAEQQFTVPITTDGAKGGDKLVNRAQARDGHTELVMRTSAPITVANYYSATLKKYVQDVNGKWHDANSAADYPAFHYGDTIHYRIVVTNTGQGTLTNIDVSDDKNPSLGGFHIDSLAPGKSQSHEYSIKLATSATGSVVNTASATADTPPDSHVPPTIPSDPAGFDVTNYTTVKKADPAAGTPVVPGQVIHYTITVAQQGTTKAAAQFSDDLSDVLDDASYNGDVHASLGTAKVTGKTLTWTGSVPVGGAATVTYSVTVHDVAGLTKGGNADLFNPVTSPGCVSAASCRTDHKTGWYTYSKTADPKSGSTVAVGDKVTYTVTVVQHGKAALANATVTDDMTKVLDDATYDKDAKPSSGRVSYTKPKLTWKGDLSVGAKVKINYSVTATGDGDMKLTNVVDTTDPRGSCDVTIGCQTRHDLITPAAGRGDESGVGGDTAFTGTNIGLGLTAGSILLGFGGLLLLAGIRRRRQATT